MFTACSSDTLVPEVERGGRVGHGRVAHVPALRALVVVEELAAHRRGRRGGAEVRHGAEEDSDRVAPADGVAELAEVGREGVVVQGLDQVHALEDGRNREGSHE